MGGGGICPNARDISHYKQICAKVQKTETNLLVPCGELDWLLENRKDFLSFIKSPILSKDKYDCGVSPLKEKAVSRGSNTRSGDSSLEVRYWILRQACLGVWEYNSIVLYSRNIWINFAVFWSSISFSCHAIFYLLVLSFIQNHIHLISSKAEVTVFSVYYVHSLSMDGSFLCINYVFTHCTFYNCLSWRKAVIIDRWKREKISEACKVN